MRDWLPLIQRLAAAPDSRRAALFAPLVSRLLLVAATCVAGPSGVAAMSSGRAGLPGGDRGGRGPVGPVFLWRLRSDREIFQALAKS